MTQGGAPEEQVRRESSAPVVQFQYYGIPLAFSDDQNPGDHRPDGACAA